MRLKDRLFLFAITRAIAVPLSLTIAIGFTAGFIKALSYILANRYIQHRMFRLVALTFRDDLNNGILRFCVAAILLCIILYFYNKFVSKKNEGTSAVYRLIVILGVFVLLDYVYRTFTAHPLLWHIERFLFNIERLFAESRPLSIDVFKDIGRLSVFFGVVVGVLLLDGLLARVRQDTLSKFIRPLKKTAVILTMLLAALNLTLMADGVINKPKGPNVILITIDALRSDHLGCYGYKRPTSPNIDLFARQAVLFKNAITPFTLTTPSMTSMFTGLLPSTHGVVKLVMSMKPGTLFLQEILRNNNYDTAAFVGNIILDRKRVGSWLSRGFSFYGDNTLMRRMLPRKYTPRRAVHPQIYERKASDLTGAALNWIVKNRGKNFFLWIHYQDPHDPYVAPKEYQKLFTHKHESRIPVNILRHLRLLWIPVVNGYTDANAYIDAYDAEIRFCDEYIGRLLKKLRELGVYENSIIIITADHGESLGEHNNFGHGFSVYDECARVPLLWHLPYQKAPRVIKPQIDITDIAPTVLDLLNYPVNTSMEGRSLRPVLFGETISGGKCVFIECLDKNIKAVRTDRWKYIKNLKSGAEKLYDLENDPLENNNVIKDNEETGEKLKSVLYRWLRKGSDVKDEGAKQAKIDEEDRKALRALGYLQ